MNSNNKKNNNEYVSEEEKQDRKFQELFPKEKKSSAKAKAVSAVDVPRFQASPSMGLTQSQVDLRIEQGLVNKN